MEVKNQKTRRLCAILTKLDSEIGEMLPLHPSEKRGQLVSSQSFIDVKVMSEALLFWGVANRSIAFPTKWK